MAGYMSNDFFRPQGAGNILPPANAGKSDAELFSYYQSLMPGLNQQDFMDYAQRGGVNPDRIAAMHGNDGPIGNPSMTADELSYPIVGHNMDADRIAAGDPFHPTAGPTWDPENDARRKALEYMINSEAMLGNHGYIKQMTGGQTTDPGQVNDMRLQALISMAHDKGGR